jgi:hypothetical protein
MVGRSLFISSPVQFKMRFSEVYGAVAVAASAFSVANGLDILISVR